MNRPTVVAIAQNQDDRSALRRWAQTRLPASVDEALERMPELNELDLGATGSDGPAEVLDKWEALASAAAADLGVARAIEPHLDALGILEDAQLRYGRPEWRTATWGVFAAEGGGDPLRAKFVDGGWLLTGTKPWCSLAGRLDHALVTAHVGDDQRALFAIELRDDGVQVASGDWHARGLVEIESSAIRLSAVPAIAVGEPGWYLERAGFDIGGIGVAACWYGGAVAIARTLFESVGATPPPLAAMHLGAVDLAIGSSRLALTDAAGQVAAGLSRDTAKLLAKRVRGIVARTVEEVIMRSAHALGPAPLAQDAAHAKRVADLELYVRQHHAERDDESLGRLVASGTEPPW